MTLPHKLITLTREDWYPEAVIGTLAISGLNICNTLEPLLPDAKGNLKTVIPAGEYSLRYNTDGAMNLKYKQYLPNVHRGMIEVENVQGHSHLYFHIGNYPSDTKGCILVGTARYIHNEKRSMLKCSAHHYGLLYAFLAYGPSNLSNCVLLIHENPISETFKDLTNV
jgi:hypothetical protein